MRTKFEIGQKYAKLTIVGKKGKDKHGNILYDCVCECGNHVIVRGNALSSGNTKSCGCYSTYIKKSKKLPDDRGVINQIILQYKRHAKSRQLDWELTYDQVKEIIQKPCFYCGEEKTNNKITKNCTGYLHNGIDRVDSKKGYFIDNVVPCCKICNYAKSDMSQKNFIDWIKKASNHIEAMAEQWAGEILE